MMNNNPSPENQILFISSYPPRECGIATYSQDLINAIKNKFCSSFDLKVCAIEEEPHHYDYPGIVKFKLSRNNIDSYLKLADNINKDERIKKVFIQHEYGLFGGEYGEYLLHFLYSVKKPVSITFHTVLPRPEAKMRQIVQAIEKVCNDVVVMTNSAAQILVEDYLISDEKISVIPHGTHLVSWPDKNKLKKDTRFENRLILSTFGLLSSNKSIETAIEAMPQIVEKFPDALYLVLGRTHPGVVRNEGEKYRRSLESKVEELGLENNVEFVNRYLSLDELLEYLRVTDVYLFTSKDPHQAVSGTFSYALSAACPVITTPIPHAKEILNHNVGISFDFKDKEQLAEAAIKLLDDDQLRAELSSNAFHLTRNSIWENTSISHARIINKCLCGQDESGLDKQFSYDLPPVSTDHVEKMTVGMGIIQFSKFCEPDPASGYTLDDNARAMIAMCMHYEESGNYRDLELISKYLNFISHCQQADGSFLNYADFKGIFGVQNHYTNLEDSNGRAIWALGTLMSYAEILPDELLQRAALILNGAIPQISKLESPRAIAFAIKGLYHCYESSGDKGIQKLIDELAKQLVSHYNAISDSKWKWFEEYLTYANSTLPEAMLCAYKATGESIYKLIGRVTFEFLLSKLFVNEQIKVISNRGWYQRGKLPENYGEQPIDVAYTVQALDAFYEEFEDENYKQKLEVAFSWFLGNNHLNQIIHDPVTGGCCDGLEERNVNLNQGAESTVCYLIARLIMEKVRKKDAEKKRPRKVLSGELVYSSQSKVKKKAGSTSGSTNAKKKKKDKPINIYE